jgi:hypothetical protein
MSPTVLRALVKLFLCNLGIFAACWACIIPAYFMTDESSRQGMQGISTALGYVAIYCFPFTIGLLVLYGITTLLIRLVDKLTK